MQTFTEANNTSASAETRVRRVRFRYLLYTLFIASVLTFTYGRPVIQNDGITYYALARSLVVDGNFELTNEAEWLRDLRIYRDARGRAVPVYSCGYAVLYAPSLWLMDRIPGLKEWRPYAQNVRIPISHGLAVLVTSVLCGVLAMWITFRLLEQQLHSTSEAYLLALCALVATSLLFYTLTSPSFAHAADAFLMSAAAYLVFAPTWRRNERGPIRNLLLGFVLSLSVLLRNINIVILPALIITRLYVQRKEQNRTAWFAIAEITAGALPTMILQFSYNWIQHRNIFSAGYAVPQIITEPGIIGFAHCLYKMGFHPSFGLLVWTPITAISLYGLIRGTIRRQTACVVSLGTILCFLFTLCYFRLFWPGSSFGHRYLAHLHPFWVIGLGAAIQLHKRTVLAAVVALAAWGFLLFNSYYITFASPYARGTLAAESRNMSPLKFMKITKHTVSKDSNDNILSVWYSARAAEPYPTLDFILFGKP